MQEKQNYDIIFFKIVGEMMKKKKLKLKKQAYYIFAGIVAIFVMVILGMNFYNDLKYKETNEAKLIAIGYTLEQAKTIEEKLSKEDVEKILNREKNETILLLLEEKYFLMKNLDSYLEYIEKDKEEHTMKDVIALVNTHANTKWYSEILKTDVSLKERMLVNKFYALDKEYNPENLKTFSLQYAYGDPGTHKIIDYAYDKYMDLWEAANEAGFYLMVNSSYRDYESQEETYESYKIAKGERKADEIAAHPGHSEHQTGLCVDMTSKDAPIDYVFKESEEYKWLKENAYKYGFIERYPEGKTHITGYSPESWHWRYVGIEAATIIHNEEITFDEYYAYYIEK